MRTHTIRLCLAAIAFFAVLQWSGPAAADVTVTGTVAEVGVMTNKQYIRFKFTDLNQTKTCNYGNFNDSIGYAIVRGNDNYSREYYAMLLVSKKGSPMTCTMLDNTSGCYVTSCTLP